MLKNSVAIVLGVILYSASTALAVSVPLATWICGQYSETNTPATLGRVVVDHTHVLEHNGLGTVQKINDATALFFDERQVIDNLGHTIVTYVVQPSVIVRSHTSWAGPAVEQFGIGSSTSAGVDYHGRIVATTTAAPSDALVPLIVRVRGFATASATYYGSQRPEAHASSGVTWSQGDFYGEANAGGQGEYADYDESRLIYVPRDEIFDLFVSASVQTFIDTSAGSNVGEAQAFADPSVEIDPTYEFKDLFAIEFSSNFPVPEPSTLVLLGTALLGLFACLPRRRCVSR